MQVAGNNSGRSQKFARNASDTPDRIEGLTHHPLTNIGELSVMDNSQLLMLNAYPHKTKKEIAAEKRESFIARAGTSGSDYG
jgi:hypothetical protein